ncbi:MAG: signal peptide peptidase SppA [Ignavibacteria bacterium]|jgi:protease-4|nr:signal peptide peptidase SppA [Ignavibacteria bacterium]MCU7518914.1 signal peptide peptidase SppA [Ignavibacteria bacterium]MCU7525136.1 signal peptide peptidase SppA [Ignavibacteria bacterium]
MKFLKIFALLVLSSAAVTAQQQAPGVQGANTQGFNTFNVETDFLLTSPGAMRYGLLGYDNPAILTYIEGPELEFDWSDEQGRWNDFKRYGLFGAIRNLGLGMIHNKVGDNSVTDYRVSLGFGNRAFSLGLGYGWSGGDVDLFGRSKIIRGGMLIRPSRYLSLGASGIVSTTYSTKELYTELAARPLGNEFITLFADIVLRNTEIIRGKKEIWSAGAALEVIPGFRITGRYFQTKAFSAGLQLSLGNIGFSGQAHYNDNQAHAYNTYGIRVGTYDRNFFSSLFPSKDYLNVTLKGELKYQRYMFFDESNTLYDIISQINAAKTDPGIKGIALNATELRVPGEMLWELRERLLDFRRSGKKVVIFLERPDMADYYFASAADKIVLDPLGNLAFQGLIAGRTFYKGTLDKLGIGFDELRFFKYKSAMESFSREDMTEADREQRQRLIDVYYDLMRDGISRARGISPEKVDSIVNYKVVLLPREAMELGLVDTLDRWENSSEVIKKIEGTKRPLVSAGSLEKYKLPDDNKWGEFERIAIIYAIGATSMDGGINARKLVKDVESAAEDPHVKAIVIRVDSPGGDAMASDYIAEAIKKYKKQKPVIISQGAVAASGGYWLSMYADTIVSAPNTITGSIGVIGAWVYNGGLSEKLGFTTDFVKRGDHADLGFGASLPFMGLGLPDRALTPEERGRIEYIIKDSYDLFITKVAEGRRLKPEYVDSVGQGRVWMGPDALKLRLVDIIGGLNEAIKVAKERAGIEKDKDIRFIQYPQMPLFDLSFLRPGILGFGAKEMEFADYMKLIIEHNGQAMPRLPVEDLHLIK